MNTAQWKSGIVESVDDPTKSGRIKVRIDGLHDGITTDNLPWCTYAGSSMFSGDGGGSISIPRKGTRVRVQFKDNDPNSMEWTGTNRISRKLAEEIADDYEGTSVLAYDEDNDMSIMFQPNSGLRLYYKGSNIQIAPDNTITIHYGGDTSGVQIQLSDGQIDIQAKSNINVTSEGAVNIEAKNVTLDGSENVQIRGDYPGQHAVNGETLYTLLATLATMIDAKCPCSGGLAKTMVDGFKQRMLNSKIQYI